MKHSLISIITPTLNQATYIKQTIHSVLSQNYPYIEYIIVDGGSTDNTIQILKEFELKLKRKKLKVKREINNDQVRRKKEKGKRNTFSFHWISKNDKGQTDAINKGLRKATGDILCYLNSDDYLEPYAVSKVMEVFQRNKRVMWVTGDCRIVNEKGQEMQRYVKWYKKILRCFPLSLILSITNPIVQPSTFWRREVLEKVGYFDETLRYTFDYDFWFHIVQKYPLTVLPIVLSAFRIHGESKGGRSYKKQFDEEMEVVTRYVNNPIFLFLHTIHNILIIWVYNVIK